jgi:hypothetical protein
MFAVMIVKLEFAKPEKSEAPKDAHDFRDLQLNDPPPRVLLRVPQSWQFSLTFSTWFKTIDV